jgi:hypothetical protein
MAGPNAYVQVNAPTTVPLGKKLATYEFPEGLNTVESEAVTLTDSAGNELLGQKPMADSVPVTFATDQAPLPIVSAPATLHNGSETPIAAVAVSILPANASRAWCLVQNTGNANIRVGVAGVDVTTGLRLVPNGVATYDQLGQTQQELFAIAEGASPSIAFTQEATIP